MSDSSWEVQKAVFTALSGVISVPVFDDVPQDQPKPYVAIGDDTIQDWSTKTTEGEESTLTLHVWSAHSGRKQVKQIMGEIKAILHLATLTLTGHTNVLTRWDFEDSFLDADGTTRHGVTRYRLLTQKD